MRVENILSQGKYGREYWLTVLALLTVFPILYTLLYVNLAQVHWLIMGGLTFSLMWILPYRFWPWVYLAVFVTRANSRITSNWFYPGRFPLAQPFNLETPDPVVYIMNNMMEPILIGLAILLLRRWRVGPAEIGEHDGMMKLHIAGVVAAALESSKDFIYVFRDGSQADPVLWFLKVFVGHFVGIMLVAPLVAILMIPKFRSGMGRILKSALLYLIPALAMFVYIGIVAENREYRELLHLKMLVSIVIFTIRHDWRGACVALFVTSFGLAVEERLGPQFSNMGILQAFVSIAGAMALLFGTALQGLRDRNENLEAALARIKKLDLRLREATVRNIETEERERRLLAANLHDEFGQSLTALQMHLAIAERTPTQPIEFGTIAQITGAMRRNIRRVLESLRPMSLDELGLYAALDRGSIRQLCETAGIRYQMQLFGDSRLISKLSEALQITIYRVVQESVTNIVRHSKGTECRVRLRVTERSGKVFVFIRIADDGIGRCAELVPGNGLRGLRDRVVALGGIFHFRDGHSGIVVHTLLEQATWSSLV